MIIEMYFLVECSGVESKGGLCNSLAYVTDCKFNQDLCNLNQLSK